MKKLLALIILIPLTGFAKFFPGTITLNNAEVISCLIDNPDAWDVQIKYKLDEKGEVQKYSIEEVQGYQFTNDRKEVFSYVTLMLSHPKTFDIREQKLNDRKSWVHLCKAGKIGLYREFYYSSGGQSGGIYGQRGPSASSGYRYYIKKSDEDFGRFIFDRPLGNTMQVGGFKVLKLYIRGYFQKTCPNFYEALTKDDLENDLISIVDKYDLACGK